MSKNPPSHSREGERERKARQRMSQPPESIGDSTNYIYDPTVPKVQEDVPTLPQRTKGRTPEESGYPRGQVDVRTGPQGQKLWRLNGCYKMPNRILCFKAGRDSLP